MEYKKNGKWNILHGRWNILNGKMEYIKWKMTNGKWKIILCILSLLLLLALPQYFPRNIVILV